MNDFLLSALSTHNPFNTTEQVIDWLKDQNIKIKVEVNQVKFSELKGWHFDESLNLRHDSGRFFSTMLLPPVMHVYVVHYVIYVTL